MAPKGKKTAAAKAKAKAVKVKESPVGRRGSSSAVARNNSKSPPMQPSKVKGSNSKVEAARRRLGRRDTDASVVGSKIHHLQFCILSEFTNLRAYIMSFVSKIVHLEFVVCNLVTVE